MAELRISGLGGQGVILSGMIIGKASALYENKHSVLTQAFGPEARGSACSAQVIVDDKDIAYPYVSESDILVSMSQEAFNKFYPELNKNKGIVVYESELVNVEKVPNEIKKFGIPATRIAEEELGRKIFLNIVMLGFFTYVTKLNDPENVKKAISATVPEKTIQQNLKAFDLGFEYGKKHYK